MFSRASLFLLVPLAARFDIPRSGSLDCLAADGGSHLDRAVIVVGKLHSFKGASRPHGPQYGARSEVGLAIEVRCSTSETPYTAR